MFIINNAVKKRTKPYLWVRPATLFNKLENAVDLMDRLIVSSEQFYKKNGTFIETIRNETEHFCTIRAKGETQIFRISTDEPED